MDTHSNVLEKARIMKKIDENDAIILRALIKDARTKLKDIAKECKISSTAVKNRIDNLEKNKIIVKSAMNIFMDDFGYPYMVLIGVNIEKTQEQNIIKIIQEHTKVAGIDQTIGNYDLCLFVFAKSVKEMDELKYTIRKQKGVKKIEINIWNKPHFNYDNIEIRSTK
jgi:DNA-binding Lrp family transcriptional regulator